jgi:hypothetical protein
VRLSRDDILKAEDLVTEEVDVPEWGGTVLVRGLTGRERDVFEASVFTERGGKAVRDLANTRAKLAARAMVDEDGKRLFTDSDVAALGEKSGAALDRVFAVASRLSGLADDDVKEMTQDFGTEGGSASSSPSPSASTRRPRSSSAK